MIDWIIRFFATIIIYGLIFSATLGVLGLILLGFRFFLKQLGVSI